MTKSYEKIVEILRIESDSIAWTAAHIDRASVDMAMSTLLSAKGKVVVVGVGKSGVIGEKISQTLTSTGTPAVFLSASEALHGGLGIISAGDVVIALSNSGETDEMLAILPAIRRRNVRIIAIVGNTRSTLATQSHVIIDASVDREACPLNLAPTASTTVALAIGDALAMALMDAKGLTSEHFAINHPAGRLGKRLTLTVHDLMHESPSVTISANWLDVIKAISSYSLGAVNVVDEHERLLGIVTDGDLRRTIERTSPDALAMLTAKDMMTRDPIAASPEMLAYEALRLMEKRSSHISVLPVIDGDACVGMVRLHDIVRHGL